MLRPLTLIPRSRATKRVGGFFRFRSGRLDRLQCPMNHLERIISILGGNAHRWLDANHIAVDSTFADQHAHRPRFLENVKRLSLRRLLRLAIANELDAEHETHSAHVTDQIVLGLQLPESILETLADDARILLQTVFI